MSNFNTRTALPGEAVVEYLSSDFRVIRPGDFVRCAVTQQPIHLDDLKYWSHERQEAYISSDAALKRHAQLAGNV